MSAVSSSPEGCNFGALANNPGNQDVDAPGKIWTDSEDIWIWKVGLDLGSDLGLTKTMISESMILLEMVAQLKTVPPPLRPPRGQQSAPGLSPACTESNHQKLCSLRSGSPQILVTFLEAALRLPLPGCFSQQSEMHRGSSPDPHKPKRLCWARRW